MKTTQLRRSLKALIRKSGYDIIKYEFFTRRWGHDIIKYHFNNAFPVDFSREDIDTFWAVQPYTATGPERVQALIQAVKYVIAGNIPGSIVECGVWKGGSVMAVARTLRQLGHRERDLYLFDTFEGMTAPTDMDVDLRGVKADEQFDAAKAREKSQNWCYAPLADVKNAVYSTGYDQERIHFVQGKVEDTLPAQAPAEIALLRLDTDWYESTRHELIHLFPRLTRGGVLIIDDYGDWEGARKAVDEYFSQQDTPFLLNRIDHTGRIGVKL